MADDYKVHRTPIQIVKQVQGEAMAFLFTWRTSQEKRVFEVQLSIDLQQWDSEDADSRKRSFLERVGLMANDWADKSWGFDVTNDMRTFAAAYDWDTDRKLLGHIG